MINILKVFTVLLFPTISIAGTLFESNAINPITGEKWKTEMFLHENNIRILNHNSRPGDISVSTSADEAAVSIPTTPVRQKWLLEKEPDEMIYNGEFPGMYDVSHKKRSAMDMTPKHVSNKKKNSEPQDKTQVPEQQSIGDYMGQITQQLNQANESMPENQQAIFKDMFSGTMGKNNKVVVIPRNQRANKLGYDVELYVSMSNGRKVREFWVTDAKNIKDGLLLIKTMKEMADLYREIMHAYAMPGRFIAMEFEDLDGKIPVITNDYDRQGELIKKTTLSAVTEVATHDEDYDPKKKYQHYQWTSGLLFE